MVAEIDELDVGRWFDLLGDEAREHHLAAVRGAHESSGAVDGLAEVVPVAFQRSTGVEAHAHPDLDSVRPSFGA